MDPLRQNKAIWHGGLSDEAQLKKLLEEHNRWTGSKRARELLDTWADSRGKFVKVFPNEYKRALGEMAVRKTPMTVKSDEKQASAPAKSAQAATKKVAAPAK